VYQKSQHQNRGLLIAALPLALIILFVLFSQGTPPRTMAQQEATPTNALSTETAPTEDPQRQVEEYASVAHALQAQALADENPFLAYRLAVEAGSIDNPPGEAYSSLLSMYFNNTALSQITLEETSANELALSEDGQTLAILTGSGTLQVYDTATRELLNSYLAPRAYLADADFTPDGSRLYLAQPDNQLVLEWEVASGRIRRLAFNEGFGTFKVAPDGQHAIAVGIYEGDFFYIDLETHETLYNFPGHSNSIYALDFSPDGNLLLVGYYDGTLILYDVTTGERLRTLQSSGAPIYTIAFSPFGGTALVGDYYGTLSAWSMYNGELMYSLPNYAPNGISSITYSPNGFYAVVGGNSGHVTLLDTEFGSAISRTQIHRSRINAVTFSADSSTFVTGDAGGMVMSWNVRPPSEHLSFYAHESGVTRVAVSPDGRYVASGDTNGTIFLSDSETFTTLNSFAEQTGMINGLDFSPDGRYLLSASADGTVLVWDMTTGESQELYNSPNNQILDANFSPDGLTAMLGIGGGGAMLLDANPDSDDFGETRRVFIVDDSYAPSVAYSPDGSLLAVGSGNGHIYISDAETGAALHHIVIEGTSNIIDLDFSPDGTILASTMNGGLIALWDVASGQRINTIDAHRGSVLSLDFSLDGRTLLSGGSDFQVVLLDVSTGQRIRTYIGHSDHVNDVTFSPDGRFALSASWDVSVSRWNIPTVPELIHHLLTERTVPELTCSQRAAYRVEPLCDSDGNSPTEAPYPTLTPTARTTTAPTLEPLPTRTPRATAVVAGNPAQVGEQRGEIEVGGGEVWTYNGSYGETLNILVEADEPANDAEDRTGLYDTYLIVRSPLGYIIYTADDIQDGIITNSQIIGLTLPTTGVYEIEIRSWDDQSGGEYTLTIESTPFVPPPSPTIPSAG
jgi:WD40 repeat protein